MNNSGPSVQCIDCLDIIQSNYRHDFQTCKCGKISIDGGKDYTRLLFPNGGTVDDFIRRIENGETAEKS